MKTTSIKGIELIKKHEGCRLQAYKCPAGVWTIGYGHTQGVKAGQSITQAEADNYLKSDLKTFESFLNRAGLRLNQNQFDALVSFIFNVGSGAFHGSTLKKKIQANPSDPTIRDEFRKWKNGGGRVLPGLVKRREDEANLYFAT